MRAGAGVGEATFLRFTPATAVLSILSRAERRSGTGDFLSVGRLYGERTVEIKLVSLWT